MIALQDQVGNKLQLKHAAKRIISLVPSITELLAYFKLDEETAGITKFCVLPDAWFRNKARVGGTKQIDIETIRSLKPDLIIANKEENVKEQVDILSKGYAVYVSDVNNLRTALQMMEDISVLTGKQAEGALLVEAVREKFAAISKPNQPIRVCYLIWQKPYMTVGGDTFIHAMLEEAGFTNVFEIQNRYPEISAKAIFASGCEHVLMSSEPFPFQQKHADDLLNLLSAENETGDHVCPDIHFVDGQIFSWYGSRLLHAPAYFQELRKPFSQPP